MAAGNAPPKGVSIFDQFIDFQSAQGQTIRLMFEARLQELRVQNDGDLKEIDTAELRGRIAEIKKWLAGAPPVVSLARFDNPGMSKQFNREG